VRTGDAGLVGGNTLGTHGSHEPNRFFVSGGVVREGRERICRAVSVERLSLPRRKPKGRSREGDKTTKRVATRWRMQYSGSGERTLPRRTPWGRGAGSSSKRETSRGESMGDEPGEVSGEGNTLKGRNPMSGSSMKQGCSAQRRQNPRRSEKGQGGMRSGWNRTQMMRACPCNRFSIRCSSIRWRGEKPHGRSPMVRSASAFVQSSSSDESSSDGLAALGQHPRESLKRGQV
jgi:hypothetical protein